MGKRARHVALATCNADRTSMRSASSSAGREGGALGALMALALAVERAGHGGGVDTSLAIAVVAGVTR